MSISKVSAPEIADRLSGGSLIKTGLMPAFTLTIFLSALLLFSVQPMFAKMTLPLLGGVPNVWNTAMVFFQGTLLAGYLYAHFLSRHAPLKWQIGIHAGVLAVGFLFLPLAVTSGWSPPAEGAPAAWLMALYAVSIGAPFFALSATAPLVQRWFSYTNHEHASDPYFLYAASNLGSLLSLVAYPVLIEPLLGVSHQSIVWAAGYYALAIAIVCAGVLAFLNRNVATHSGRAFGAGSVTEAAPAKALSRSATLKQQLTWIGLAFVPSSLMLGVTTHFSVNVATTPFVWVAPLALYLLTFVIVFAKNPPIRPEIVAQLLPAAVVTGGLMWVLHDVGFFLALFIHLLIFFIVALHFHGILASQRPVTTRLTEFYICMSIGGVLGGIFNALIAPVIFSNVYEYGLILAIAGIAAVGRWPDRKGVLIDVGFAVLTFAVITGVILVLRHLDMKQSLFVNVSILSAYVLVYLQNRRPVRFVAGLLALEIFINFVALRALEDGNRNDLFQHRNFFGVTRVSEKKIDGKSVHQFVHGNTIHGLQYTDPGLRKERLAYYDPRGPFGKFVEVARDYRPGDLDIGIVGLGAGAFACYANPSEAWTFYEIDPAVVEMALDRQLFTYLSDCQPKANIIVGDARLQLQNAPDNSADFIIIDAFSSDAIPAHLITREALALYREKLKDGGVIFFHTSNRFMDVASVVMGIAGDAALDARVMEYSPGEDAKGMDALSAAIGVAVGNPDVMDRMFADHPEWEERTPHPAVGVWTDDYSHIFGALLAGQAAK